MKTLPAYFFFLISIFIHHQVNVREMVKQESNDSSDMDQTTSATQLANAFLRRNRPGTSSKVNKEERERITWKNIKINFLNFFFIKDWCRWPEEGLEEMESTLAVQQFIQQLIRRNPNDLDLILQPPDQQDESIWKYEQVREFCAELNLITCRLQHECTPDTCTQMTATEQWIFLCAAHKNPKECSAIDYTRHTLDGAACLLNSNRYFPSRVNIKESSVQKLGSVCRRIYRIFSHAYYHHRKIYDEFECETSLCKRFTKFVLKYDLMTSETLIVPIDEQQNTQSNEQSTNINKSSNADASSSYSSTLTATNHPENQVQTDNQEKSDQETPNPDVINGVEQQKDESEA
jgi:hypothetical protein